MHYLWMWLGKKVTQILAHKKLAIACLVLQIIFGNELKNRTIFLWHNIFNMRTKWHASIKINLYPQFYVLSELFHRINRENDEISINKNVSQNQKK